MTYVPYSYKHPSSRRYVFISVGKKRIEKVVDFVPLKAKNIMNPGILKLLFILREAQQNAQDYMQEF
jgi:hypothetical protein